MNGLLTYRIARQQNAEAIDQATKNSLIASIQVHGGVAVRRRIAVALVRIASYVQPGLSYELPQPNRPATA